MYQAFPIASFESGVRTDREPWLLPHEACSLLENGHVYRGQILKRPPARLLTKLGTKIIGEGLGTPGAGLRTVGNWPSAPAVSTHARIGVTPNPDQLPLVEPTATPAVDKPIVLTLPPYVFKAVGPEISTNIYALEWDSGTALTQPYTGRVNVATGEWYITVDAADTAFTAAAGSVTYEFYRGLPAMLIHEWTNAAGTRELVVCDTRRLFVWNQSRLRFDDKLATGATLAADDVFTIGDSDFFSAATVDDGGSRKLVLVNGVDLPKKWSGAALANMGVSAQLTSARFVFAQYGHVVYLSPIVGGTVNRQRAMWSDQFLTETVQASNVAVTYTGERLVTAAMIQDEIIAVYDRSVWKLRYTGDFRVGAQFEWVHVAGGVFDRQDTLGALSPMGIVALHDHLIAPSAHGITRANGAQAQEGADGTPNLMGGAGALLDPTRMNKGYGVAFDAEHKALFSAVTPLAPSDEPDATLVVDVKTGAISFYRWAFRIFGLFRRQEQVPNWDDVEWKDTPFDEVDAIVDGGAGRSGFPTVLAGTLDGSIYEIPGDSSDELGDSTMIVELKQMNPFVERGAQADFGWLHIVTKPAPGETMTVKLYRDYEDSAWATHVIDLDPVPGKTRIEKRIRVNCTANAHKVRIEQTGDDRWAIDAIVPYFQPAAEWARYAT